MDGDEGMRDNEQGPGGASPGAVDGASPRPRTVAEKLTRLFEVLHSPGSPPLSTREVAKRVKNLGGSISPTYISELRTGVKKNPSLEHIVWLSQAFGVSAGYFTDPEVAERVDVELDMLAAHHQNPKLAELAEQTVSVAQRTASLDESDKQALGEMVKDYWRRLKGRDPGDHNRGSEAE